VRLLSNLPPKEYGVMIEEVKKGFVRPLEETIKGHGSLDFDDEFSKRMEVRTGERREKAASVASCL